LLLPSSGQSPDFLGYPEDEGRKLLQTVEICVPIYTASSQKTGIGINNGVRTSNIIALKLMLK
jgi:hypothetical protein